ncbi:MAG: hypothetical protein SNJ84_10310, partial [Verrucomicrobiia bacterium]
QTSESEPTDATPGQNANADTSNPSEPNPQTASGSPPADTPPSEPQDQPANASSGDLQEIGGGSTAANPSHRDDVPPDLQGLMSRLDQLRENDTPGRIHQLFAPEERLPEPIRKTW